MRVLVVGESWVSLAFHVKGFNAFQTATYSRGGDELLEALRGVADVDYLPNERVPRDMPSRWEELAHYDAIVLSDVGADSLLLHPDTWIEGKRTPNRLRELKRYVAAGGRLVMAGGYYSFQGIGGAARYRGSPVEEVLPVALDVGDDRLEEPAGLDVTVELKDNPLVEGLSNVEWPYLLGLNRVQLKPGVQMVARCGSWPLLVAGKYGRGVGIAWMSDVGPHWCPKAFVEWPGYAKLWQNLVRARLETWGGDGVVDRSSDVVGATAYFAVPKEDDRPVE